MKTLIRSLAAVLALALSPAHAAGKLEDALRKSGWLRILGTWHDEETGGKKFTTTYAWRFPGTLIEETTRADGKEIVALIGMNSKSSEVFHLSADSEGGNSIGAFKNADDGTVRLGVLFTTPDGNQGALNIRFRFEDDDTLVLTVETPEPLVFRLKRALAAEGQGVTDPGDAAE